MRGGGGVATSLDVHSEVTGNVTFQDTVLAHAHIELDMNTCRPLINIVKYYFTPICILYLFVKMGLGAVDYAASYFKYKTPTPIQGAPTNKTLKRLKQELRANASSVESDLGGGDHGYLGLVLTDIEYTTVCVATAFTAPVFPITPLVIPIGTDQVQALNLRE